MQQQQQQPGGSQFGVLPSEMAPFPSSGAGPRPQVPQIPGADPIQPSPLPSSQLAEVASPISSRSPPPAGSAANFDQLVPAVAGGFPDDEALAGSAPGNRWPRQETLALLKIRSEMVTAFRDSTFKGPLWEEVSRKLAELGYKRSAKKCKEKFENVHKYYKRTKEGRAGRQDGKTYRFFSELEALHGSGGGGATTTTATTAPPSAAASPTPISFNTAMAGPSATRIQPSPVSAAGPTPATTSTRVVPELAPQLFTSSATAAAAAAISFSWNSSSSSSESDDEETEETGGSREERKRKRCGRSRARRQMMDFFQGLMKQVMDQQETMQRQFLEAIEKRDQDRMIREDAWRRQEMVRFSQEQEMLAQERAMAASRDSAVISYLQKVSGQSATSPAMVATAVANSITSLPLLPLHAPPPPPDRQQLQQHKPPLPAQPLQQQQADRQHTASTNVVQHQPSSATQLVPISSEPEECLGSRSFEPTSSSRWPKAEVHTLIKLRSGLGSRYQEAGPKGPLWEEISVGMQRLGYTRSAKRCKEKWENINKYFKKVKHSSKKRPEDSKTCPYFHELDALYGKKMLGSVGDTGGCSSTGGQQQQEQDTNLSPQEQPPAEAEGNNGDDSSNRNGGYSEAGQVQTSNGRHPPSIFEEETKKPEDTVTEQGQLQQALMDDEPNSDNLDQDDEDDDADDEDSKMQYKVQFQRQIVNRGGGGNASTAAAAATAAGSFMAVVQ